MLDTLHHQLIARARNIIKDPKHWTQGELARFKNGRPAIPQHPHTHRFCAIGALIRAANELTKDRLASELLVDSAKISLDFSARSNGGGNLQHINDGEQGHARVLELFHDYMPGNESFLRCT